MKMDIFSPVLQAGFAAFAVLQLVFIYMLVREIVRLTERITTFGNSIQQLTQRMERLTLVLKEVIGFENDSSKDGKKNA